MNLAVRNMVTIVVPAIPAAMVMIVGQHRAYVGLALLTYLVILALVNKTLRV